MTNITDPWAEHPCPYRDGELLEFTRGEFRGKQVRVNGAYSFWSQAWRYNNDPNEPLHPASWQIVLDIFVEGKGWLYFIRESAKQIEWYTRRVEATCPSCGDAPGSDPHCLEHGELG